MRSRPLIDRYGGVVCDLDGVVYRGAAPVPHAVAALNRLKVAVIYATNNASRTPMEVAGHLGELGVHTDEHHVVTSAMAGAGALAARLPARAAVLAIGGPGVSNALRSAGLRPISPDAHGRGEPVEAVLQGYGGAVCATDLAEAAYAVAGGAHWVVTNVDETLPTDRGIAPGNGTLVAAVQTATGAHAEVVGKPAAPLYEMAARIIGAPTAALLAIGDRLETDIAGAIAAGMESVLVCTGVHGPREIALAPANARPTCVLRDLRGLTQPYVAPLRSAAGWECGGAQVAIVDNALHIDAGPERREEVARAAIAAIWEAIDAGLDRDHAASLANHIPGLD